MKTEHEKLKWICDEIGYERNYDNYRLIYKERTWDNEYRLIDVREIIFTQEFKNKFINYIFDIVHKWEFELTLTAEDDFNMVINNLDNPTDYLYNLLK